MKKKNSQWFIYLFICKCSCLRTSNTMFCGRTKIKKYYERIFSSLHEFSFEFQLFPLWILFFSVGRFITQCFFAILQFFLPCPVCIILKMSNLINRIQSISDFIFFVWISLAPTPDDCCGEGKGLHLRATVHYFYIYIYRFSGEDLIGCLVLWLVV